MLKKISTRVYIDPDLLEWLKEESVKRHCSMAQLIRTAIVELMKQSKF